jgi:outer membrane protein OmpA-like peptidoglycan-associated protein
VRTTIPSTRLGSGLLIIAVASLSVAACSAPLTKPDGADAARNKLTQLQADAQLATRAPVAIKEAELAVRAAEVPRKDRDEARHLVIMADRKVDIATARAQARLAEDERKTLSEQRESARLTSRTREADAARGDADAARMDTAAAQRQAADLRAQIAELNAQATDRGLVVTLGDVLFASGKSDLKGGSTSNLAKLSAFLNEYQDRTVVIEGHTDSVGAADYNQGLSQRRADAVKSYLVSQGVASSRLVASGMGQGSPIASNDSATGRQQNRRVEVIISNTVASTR